MYTWQDGYLEFVLRVNIFLISFFGSEDATQSIRKETVPDCCQPITVDRLFVH